MIKLEHSIPQNILTRYDEIYSPTPTVRTVNSLGHIVATVATLSSADKVQGSFSQ